MISPTPTQRCRWMIELGLVIGILVVAAVVRLVRLDQLPPGLYHDEAYEGLDALRVLSGQAPIYFPANNGREPIYVYLVALPIRLLGRSPGAIRVASALTGMLTVLAAYLLGRAMSGPRVGLLTGAITATTVWTIHLSRLGLRMVTLPPLMGLFLWQGALAYRTGRLRHWIASGVFYGASFYTYLSARVTPIALFVLLVYLLITRRAKTLWPGVVAWLIATAVVIAPLAVYAAGHWEVVMGRTVQVSLFRPDSPASGALQALQAAPSHLLMFVVSGDPVARHNIPLRPVFDPLMAAVFVGGLVLCLVNWRRALFAFPLIWTLIMLLPSVLSSGIPSFTRSTGVLPVAFLIPALALDATWGWVRNRFQNTLFANAWPAAVVLLVLAISAGISVRDYFFGPYGTSQAIHDDFSTSAVDIAVDANRYLGTGWQGQGLRADEGQWIPNRTLIIDRSLWFFSVGIRYLVLARPDRTPNVWFLDTAESEKPPRTARTKLVVPSKDYEEHLELLPHPSLIHVRVGPMAGGFPDNVEPFRLYLSFTTEPLPKSPPLPVGQLGDVMMLQAAQGRAGCKQLDVELAWQAMRPLDTDHTAFVHVMEGEQLIAQSDGQPGDGFYPTSWWQTGDWIADARMISLPAPFNPARQRVRVGMYRLDTAGAPQPISPPIDITDRIVVQCTP